jgi:SNF2 family DNA or RNA helicase
VMLPPEFKLGDRVSLNKNVQTKGRIDYVHPPQGGYVYYDVVFDDTTLKTNIPETDLVKEVIAKTPWDLIAQNALEDYRNFSIAATMYKVRNTTTNTISSLKASRTFFYPYQFKPLVKFLRSDIKRLLIADEVGLGKTIEAGHILLEMATRGNIKNVLVICSNSLRDKWKYELQDKFNFTFEIYGSKKEFLRDLNDIYNGSNKYIFGIVNYEKCRGNDIQGTLEATGFRFDLLICDEAHRIRNSETKQHKGVASIVEYSDAVIFMTATPIMTGLDNLYNIVRLLDKNTFNHYDLFRNVIQQNRPFVKALSLLNQNETLSRIAYELDNSIVQQQITIDQDIVSLSEIEISKLFENDRLYARARNNLLTGEDTIENRVSIQRDLIELNSLNYIYTRTRKRDVLEGEQVVIRQAHTISVSLSQHERELYDNLISQYDDENNLGLMQRKRQISSSIVAYHSERFQLEQGVYNQNITDSKFSFLENNIIYDLIIIKGKKLVIFSFFTNTLLYLKAKLNEKEIQCEIIYGPVKDRTDRIDRFQNDPNVKVLLSSEVGSEGIDLQFCDTIVNYDLPWNPMVVEQRIGRIDRIGQKSNIIHIYNLILKDTIEEKIYHRLYDRIQLFKTSIGDLEEILGEKEELGKLVINGIHSLYQENLTEEQQNSKLDQIYWAMVTNRKHLEELRQELSESFANDMHFQNEVEFITKNNRYLTREEIIQFIRSIVRIELPFLQLSKSEDEVYLLRIPQNNQDSLFDFIERYKDVAGDNPELDSMYRKFKRYIGLREIPLTLIKIMLITIKTLSM